MMVEKRTDLRLPLLEYAIEKDYKKGGAVCVCSAGRAKCDGVPSLWTRDFYKKMTDHKVIDTTEDAYGYLRKNLFTQIDSLKIDGITKRVGKLHHCILKDKYDDVKKAVDAKDLTLIIKSEALPELLEEEIVTPTGEKIKVPFKPTIVKRERSPQWKTQFSESFWKGADKIWKDTIDTDREYQMAICLRGLDIVGGGKIVGNPESVEALDRDLFCPDDSIKIGSIHTHPPEAQRLLEKSGLSRTAIEKTNVHSIPDLRVMIKFNELIGCVKSERSTTCLVNHSDLFPRELFRDMITGTKSFSSDKVKFVGEMNKRGIRKHRYVENSLSVEYPGIIKCGPEGVKMVCKTSGKNLGTLKEISTRFQDIHTTGLEVSPKFDKKEMVMEYEITPHTNEQASCWVGYDGYIWCDGHESLQQTAFSKKTLQPLYEKRIWEILNKDLKYDMTSSPFWELLNHYINILKTSTISNDQQKGKLLLGAMKEYEEDKDGNNLTRTILPLLTII